MTGPLIFDLAGIMTNKKKDLLTALAAGSHKYPPNQNTQNPIRICVRESNVEDGDDMEDGYLKNTGSRMSWQRRGNHDKMATR